MDKKSSPALGMAFKAVGLGMAAACIVLNAIKVGSTDLYITLLSIGLFGLAVGSISEDRDKS
jgi:ATP:corrinoid adenosyltransferase